MRSIEGLAGHFPYETIPGNHEFAKNYSHYDARFSMIGDYLDPKPNSVVSSRVNNHFYSFDIGPAHVLMFSTEYYIYTQWGWDQIRQQYQFIEEDLKQANQNRDKRPWIIVMGHRPIYCLRLGDKNSCKHDTLERPKIRQGLHWMGKEDSPLVYGVEKLFYDQGVDIQFYAHEHFYARFWPIYNFEYHDKSNPYHNAKAPIHITTGTAGNRQLHATFNPRPSPFVANRTLDYGYTRFWFTSKHEIQMEQTSVEMVNWVCQLINTQHALLQHNIVVDKITISKTTNFPSWISKN